MTDRKAFEAWAISDGGYHRSVPMHKDFTGEYIDGDLNEAWETWQAAITSQADELAALRAALQLARPYVRSAAHCQIQGRALEAIDAAMAAHKEPSA